jgi:2-keto-3-deoxy-6-phosphogluconate aldolase
MPFVAFGKIWTTPKSWGWNSYQSGASGYVYDLKIDFIVSPGSSSLLINSLLKTDVPFITGVVMPSEILHGLKLGCTVFKFFPANLFGGVSTLKTYGQVFPQVKFCPTGGISAQANSRLPPTHECRF